MSSRDYTKHLVSSTPPTNTKVGDEYYDPVTNKLYKKLAVNGTTVTDVEVLTTQLGSAFSGARSQIFTASGTFTIPAGISAIKVTVIGGGGGGAGGSSYPTESVAGGTSSVSSGTQSITTISAGGGGNARAIPEAGLYSAGAGGTATGGDINVTGVAGSGRQRIVTGVGCCALPAGWQTPSTFDVAQAVLGIQQKNYYYGTYGSNGIAANNTNAGNNGGQGACAIKYLTRLTPAATLSVTVGAAGTAGNVGGAGGTNYAGGAGVVVIEW